MIKFIRMSLTAGLLYFTATSINDQHSTAGHIFWGIAFILSLRYFIRQEIDND